MYKKFTPTIIIVLLLCSLTVNTNAQIVSGTVTQAFNASAAAVADGGTKVFAIKYDDDAMALFKTVENFMAAKKYRSQNANVSRLTTLYTDSAKVVKGKKQYEATYTRLQNTITQIKADADERNAQLKVLEAETNIKFDALDQRTAKALSQLKLKAFDNRTVADATGNFSLKVTPEKYVLLLVSNNRTGLTSTEVSGKVYVQLIEVKEGDNIKVINKFFPD